MLQVHNFKAGDVVNFSYKKINGDMRVYCGTFVEYGFSKKSGERYAVFHSVTDGEGVVTGVRNPNVERGAIIDAEVIAHADGYDDVE